jgi:MATE family multidrug resistance protein
MKKHSTDTELQESGPDVNTGYLQLFKRIWNVSYPMMISYFWWVCMFFTDRILLAQDTEASFLAAVNASLIIWTCIEGVSFIASMAEVFVAQYHGAKRFDLVSTPVWQMIYLSLISGIFFIPLALWGGPWIYNLFGIPGRDYSLEIVYFKYVLLFGPMFPLCSALSGFFLGRGKTQLMIWAGLVSNLVNVVSDSLLIFGNSKLLIPAMGVQGAALSTGVSQSIYTLILLCVFLSAKNRRVYNSLKVKFIPWLFKRCIAIGSAFAFSYTLELVGWTLFLFCLGGAHPAYTAVIGVNQTFLISLGFFSEGLMKGMISVSGNLIGSKQFFLIPRALVVAVGLVLLFSLVVALPVLLIYSEEVIDLFIKGSQWSNGSHAMTVQLEYIQNLLLKTLPLCCVAFCFRSIAHQFQAILIAAGDVRFIALTSPILLWVGHLIPSYYAVIVRGLPLVVAYQCYAVYAAISLVLYGGRVYYGKWKEIKLVESDRPQA